MTILGLSRCVRPGLVALVAVAFMAGCGGGPPTPNDSSGSSTPGQSAGQSAPTSALAVRGSLNLPSLPADAIPWDEVGLGWFLLAYDPGWNGREQVPGDEGASMNSPTEEEVYLVSPDASIYFVRDLTGLGNGRVGMWLGLTVGFHEDLWSGESIEGAEEGRVTAVDLQTGASQFLVGDWMGNERLEGVLPSGELVTQELDDNWSPVTTRARDLSGARELCYFGEAPGGSSIISPDGSRAICTELRSDGKSDVVLYDFATATSETIDVFKYSPSEYGASGWVDTSSVVIYRWDEESDDWRYWTYNVDTQTLSDYTYDERQPPIKGFGANAHRVVVNGESRANADSVTIQTVDGLLGATIPLCRSLTQTWFSQANAVVACYDTETNASLLYLTSLSTGQVVALPVPYETQSTRIQVFPALAP